MRQIHWLSVLFFLFLFIACNPEMDQPSSENEEYSSPEAQGVSSQAILGFIEALETEQPNAIHSLMIRRHGLIIAQGWWEPFSMETPHLLYSLSKSFTSTAIGMAQDEGLLSIDDPVISFFPEETPEEISNNLGAMRIRDLLKMNSGHQVGTSGRMMGGDSWARGFLSQEVQHKPGTHFVYNSGATYMLSAIIQKVTGRTLVEFLTPRLFDPLGIDLPTWESDPAGINVGGWGLSVRTADISKLGQLYLQNGTWNEKQLISKSWVKEATSLQSSNGSNPASDWEQGYGYQFWRCRHNAYRGDGAFGQFCLVLPEQDAVIAITAGSSDMQGILNVIWDHLLPAFEELPLPPDEENVKLLNSKLGNLAIAFVNGEARSKTGSEVTGNLYSMAPNGMGINSVQFNFDASPVEITMGTDRGDQVIKIGFDNMLKGILDHPQLESDKIAVNGAWISGKEYKVVLHYYETPHNTTFSFKFDGDKLTWDTELNVSFGPTKLSQLEGIAQ